MVTQPARVGAAPPDRAALYRRLAGALARHLTAWDQAPEALHLPDFPADDEDDDECTSN